MTSRYSYFSHIERLRGGSLVLTDPFETDRTEGSVCRYELHRATPETLEPDPDQGGLKAYHCLLPVSRDCALSQQSFMVWETLPAEHTASLARIRFDPCLYFAIGLALAGEDQASFNVTGNPLEKIFLDYQTPPHAHRELWLPSRYGGDYSGSGFAFFDGSVETAVQKRAPRGDLDFSAWGNPFRLEGLKLIGLTTIHRFKKKKPVFLVHDPVGELLYALFLASRHYRTFFEEPPFRTVLIQTRPYDLICRSFEGAEPDWQILERSDNETCLRPPERVVSEIVSGLAEHQGTAISLPHPGTGPVADLFEAALDLLVKTGFVDDEDHLLLLSP